MHAKDLQKGEMGSLAHTKTMGSKFMMYFKKCVSLLTLFLGLHAPLSYAAEEITVHVAPWDPHFSSEKEKKSPLEAYLKTLLDKAEIKHKFVYTNWQRAYRQVLKGRDALTAPWIITPERAEKFLFSKKPLFTGEGYIFFNPNVIKKASISSLSNFKNHTIAYPRSYASEDEIKEAGASLISVNNYETAIRMIHAGRADATLVFQEELEEAYTTIAEIQKNNPSFKLDSKKIIDYRYYIMFSKNVPGIKKILQKVNKAHQTMPPYIPPSYAVEHK